MAPLAAVWTGIIYVFNFFTNSPHLFEQGPGLQIPVQPETLVRPPPFRPPPFRPPPSRPPPRYPIFNPPDELEDIPFRCEYPDYPESEGWVSCNTATDRQCWLKNTKTGQRFDINTDYENVGPKGVVRKYYLNVSEDVRNPDGNGNVPVQLFNNSFPGPRLQACWGDQIQITIKNLLNRNESNPADQPGNGTTIHWHGFRMLNTGFMDGVNAVTQCPIAPGQEFTYVFNATQYGTSWYHSHYSLQYAAGALGPFTVYGPMSANFDHQMYPIIMSDWLHTSVWDKWDNSINGPPESSRIFIDNILQNGVGHWPPLDQNGRPNSTVGSAPHFNELYFQKGVKYLLRLINGAADTTFVFSIDNHKLKVISTDFVAIEPYETDHVVVGIGQRYNIIIEAIPDQFTPDQNYWIRTIPAPNCTSFSPSALKPDEHTGIVRYSFNSDLPSTSRQNYQPNCADETYYQHLEPKVKWNVPETRYALDPFYLSIHRNSKDFPYYPCDKGIFRFELVSGHPMWLNWSAPTILNMNANFSQKPWLANVTTKEVSKDTWIQLNIFSGAKKSKAPLLPHPLPKVPGLFIPGQHPIHLHGHDFAVLDQCVPDSDHECDLTRANLTLINPPRRDVVFLPDNGYLILAFKADNPGVWTMHCHIAFHASSGLAAQIIENKDQTRFPIGWDEPFFDMCKAWNDWSLDNASDPCMRGKPDVLPLQMDSGI